IYSLTDLTTPVSIPINNTALYGHGFTQGTFTSPASVYTTYYIKINAQTNDIADLTLSISSAGMTRLTINAFIPYDHIDDQHPVVGLGYIFQGDKRTNFVENGSSRLSQLMDIWNAYQFPSAPVFAPDSPHDWVGLTQRFEAATSLGPDGFITQT